MAIISGHQFHWRLGKGGKIRAIFRQIVNRQEAVNFNAARLQIQEREAIVIPLPISMHTGQIILLTKLLTASDLQFYDL